jgi:adenylate cyclase
MEIINSEIRIFKKTGFKRNVIDGYHRLVTVYMATNEWGKAKEFNAYCLEYFSKTHLTIDFNAELKRNAEICTHLGDYKTAYEQLDSFIDIQSSLQNTESQNKISGLESAVVAEKKQTEIDLINKDKEQQKILRNFLIAGCLLILITALIILRSRMQKQRDNITITKEKQRSDDLLLNILPSEVAEELKNKGNAEAKYFDEVTVLFTDFVGFTKVSERLTPTELVGELNACFSAFDGIMGKYNIEKIKTVGDAYLAVSGLPLPDSIHAGHVVKAAIEIRDFMLERGKLMGNKTFEIRIGIHSGSVVAGIVGVKKFAYDIWGDTVNTAARMEQNSEAGKINISQTTYELVKDKFDCEYRGEIEAKNKGKLKMYYASSTVASA